MLTYCLFFCVVGNCSAQLSQLVAVPVLKEDKKIDDLMTIILKQDKASGGFDKNSLKDSCWMVEIFKWNADDVSFQIVKYSKSAMNFRINAFEHQKANYGYFNFKGSVVFVWTKDDFGNFFSATGAHQTFKFLFYSNDTPASQDGVYPKILHYKFVDGAFAIEGPPPVKQVIKSD
jgi:hypothetical protein